MQDTVIKNSIIPSDIDTKFNIKFAKNKTPNQIRGVIKYLKKKYLILNKKYII